MVSPSYIEQVGAHRKGGKTNKIDREYPTREYIAQHTNLKNTAKRDI